jgi:hypothetical protein
MKKTLNNVVVLILFLKNNSYIIDSSNVLFVHMMLMNSGCNLVINLGETYLATENGNKN